MRLGCWSWVLCFALLGILFSSHSSFAAPGIHKEIQTEHSSTAAAQPKPNGHPTIPDNTKANTDASTKTDTKDDVNTKSKFNVQTETEKNLENIHGMKPKHPDDIKTFSKWKRIHKRLGGKWGFPFTVVSSFMIIMAILFARSAVPSASNNRKAAVTPSSVSASGSAS